MLEGLEITEKVPDCIGAFLPEEGQPIWVVSAIYSTGDSYSHQAGAGIEFIACFKTEQKANRCAAQLRAHADLYGVLNRAYTVESERKSAIERYALLLAKPLEKKKEVGSPTEAWDVSAFEPYMAYWMDEQDQIQTISPPWNGHFDSLDSISYDAFDLKPRDAANFQKKLLLEQNQVEKRIGPKTKVL
jgi:hypothetical protein